MSHPVLRDRLLSPLVTMRSSVEYDARFAPRALVTTLGDESGRTTVVKAERFSLPRCGAGPIVMDDVGCRVEIDGLPGTSHAGLAWTRGFIDGQLAPAPAAMR